MRWLETFGVIDAVGVEGTGAWGASLARFLTEQSVTVIEVRRGNRQHRRRHGKSDPTDAVSAARAVQSGEEHGAPKTANGNCESIRLLLIARRSAMKTRSQTANRIYAVIDTAPESLRARFHGQPVSDVVAAAARFTSIDSPPPRPRHWSRSTVPARRPQLRCLRQPATTRTGFAPPRRSLRSAECHRSMRAAMETAGTLRPSADPAVRTGLVIVIALGAWVLRPLLEDALDVSLFDPDGLQRWLREEQDLFRHGILQSPPERTRT